MENNTKHNQYEIGEWREDEVKTWWAYIYIAGDISPSEIKCRELCFPKGLCVTIEPVKYIYAGGAEEGFRVGMIQYPPFPEDEEILYEKAITVGRSLAELNYQWSFTIVTPNGIFFHSRRRK